MTIGGGPRWPPVPPRAGPPPGHRTRAGAMIGGLVAMTLDKSILASSGGPSHRRVTGTNGSPPPPG